MSEFVNAKPRQRNFRWHLLSTVSAWALVVTIANVREARAENDVRPTLWIELGGQLEASNGSEEHFNAPFFEAITQAGFASPLTLTKPSRFSIGGEGKLLFEPLGTDWVFSAAVRYGRSTSHRRVHPQVNNVTHFTWALPSYDPVYHTTKLVHKYFQKTAKKFAETNTDRAETHSIIDFQAGKDVGLGIFARDAVASFGVRFAQFSSKGDVAIYARPDAHFVPHYLAIFPSPLLVHHDYSAGIDRKENFRGIGPSISLEGDAFLAGNKKQDEVTFDWGVNGAVLFGRQNAMTQHHSSERYFYSPGQFNRGNFPSYGYTTLYKHAPPAQRRTRSVVVPNLGGFAGVSLRFPNAKISLGYRADFFLGAMDGGIDARKTYDRDFYGPFATISIGLGG